MNFGKTIASFRKKWGIEQKDLAKAIGVSKTYISIVESGHRKPSMRMLTKIADYFEVPLSFLFYEASKTTGTEKSKKEQDALAVIDPIIQKLAKFLMTKEKGTKIKSGAYKKVKQ